MASSTNSNNGLGSETANATATTTTRPKLHGRAFYESLGSPKYVVAPMVDQSEFAWRMLTRSFLTPEENSKVLAYTPMFHARLFEETAKYRDAHFQATHPSPTTPKTTTETGTETETQTPTTPFLDGNPAFDRPLFVQFCANDPAHLLGAAQLAAPHCDAVDLNLGCPQGIARKGHYGAFLQEDQALVYDLIHALHQNLSVPVTAKIRILETREATLAYARNVLAAGASILTVHGRRREQKGHLTGLADWAHIRYLRENLPEETVLFANGNVLQPGDLERCLEATGADAVMSAEGNLSNPALFARPPPVGQEGREYWRPLPRDGSSDGAGAGGVKDSDKGGWRVDAVFRRYLDILHRHALQRDPPERRPLFVVGDDEGWLQGSDNNSANGKGNGNGDGEQEEEGPARKKRKRDNGGEAGGKGKGKGKGGKAGKEKREKTTSPNLLSVRPHLFHLLRHLVSRHIDIRDALARCPAGDMEAIERVLDMVERRVAGGLIEYERSGGKSVEEEENKEEAEVEQQKQKAAVAVEGKEGKEEGERREQEQEQEDEDGFDPESSVAAVRACKRPWWVVQPIVRPLPKEALAKGSIQLSRKELRRQELEQQQGVINTNGSSKKGEEEEEDGLMKLDGKEAIKEPLIVDENRNGEKKLGVPTDELVAG